MARRRALSSTPNPVTLTFWSSWTRRRQARARRWTELADALEKLLGCHVDLVNPRYIRNPYFLQAVNNSRTVIYDRQNALDGEPAG